MENLGNLEIWELKWFGAGGAEPRAACENIKKLVGKSMEYCQILKLSMKF